MLVLPHISTTVVEFSWVWAGLSLDVEPTLKSTVCQGLCLGIQSIMLIYLGEGEGLNTNPLPLQSLYTVLPPSPPLAPSGSRKGKHE